MIQFTAKLLEFFDLFGLWYPLMKDSYYKCSFLEFVLRVEFNSFALITWSCNMYIYFFFLDGQKQEVTLGGGASRQCFYDLTPSSQYQISVRTQMQETEGPSVSITDMTRTS